MERTDRTVNIKLGELNTKKLKEDMEQVSYNKERLFKLDSSMLELFCNAMNTPKRFRLYLELIMMVTKHSSKNTSLRTVIIISRDVRKELKVSCGIMTNQEFSNCIRQLRDSNLIIEVGASTYWINPLYVFIGTQEMQKEVVKEFKDELESNEKVK